MLGKGVQRAPEPLEEPPEHAKFIFATTEIRKVPVTVLSRCQRFDLRRVEAAELMQHLARVAEREQVRIAPQRCNCWREPPTAAWGRAVSLDQAIAHGVGAIEPVREMLGLVDRSLCFDILDAVMQGDAPTALALLDEQYRSGADPLTLLEDLLDLTHWLTRLKLRRRPARPARTRGGTGAWPRHGECLSMAITRAWQMLLKGLSEARVAESAACRRDAADPARLCRAIAVAGRSIGGADQAHRRARRAKQRHLWQPVH